MYFFKADLCLPFWILQPYVCVFRNWANKTEGPKIIPTNHSKVFKITFNRVLCNKLIQKNSLPSTVLESQFSDKQKLHSAPKKRRAQYRIPEKLTTHTVIRKKKASSA
jgi:hypothetical protein